MLSITQIGGMKRTKSGNKEMNGAQYYAEYLSSQAESGEPKGIFIGDGLADFGLENKEPDLDTLNHLFRGEDQDGKKLIKGTKHRKHAYDLTFNCGKDVSILFALASEEERSLIQQAQQNAVEKAIEYIQNNATYSRTGKAGEEKVQVKRLIAATFEHSTARQAKSETRPSVHLHTHAVIPNMVRCDDGVVRTLQCDFYRHQMSASAIHSAELSSALQKLGYAIEPDKNGFRVAGVPEELKKSWSGRRSELLAAEKELKLDHATNVHTRRKLAALGSRGRKTEINRDDLFKVWQQEAKEMGVELESIRTTRAQEKPEPWSVEKTLESITEQQSTFDEIGLYKHIALTSIVDGDAKIIEGRFQQTRNSPELINLGAGADGEHRFTTKEVLEIEQGIQSYAKGRKSESSHAVKSSAIDKAIRSRSLSEEQEQMLLHCCKADGVIAVQGSAGSGKSYSLGAVKDAYQASGYKVMGCALSAVAAQNLQEGSGIQSGTIHRLLIDMEIGSKSLDDKSVVIIDEAGTADSRLINKLMMRANGAKLIFVGDTHQLEAIGLSFFRNLQQNIGYIELSENRRQQGEADKQAVSDFRGGKISEALMSYAKRGLLSISDHVLASQDKLISDWDADRQKHGDNGIILASTNAECRELNNLARAKLREAGELGVENQYESEYGYIDIAEDDRIMFTKNDIRLGVKNGIQATVLNVSEDAYQARLDDGEVISVNVDEYGYFKHSYAISTHKSQGQSVSRSYIFSSGKMISKEMGYVQLTRAKNQTKIYADKEMLGDLALDELSKQMSKSQQKETVLDML
ncbi:Ti-type conjugative transfer relaxase TraA [Mariprofundus aestuarium]|uniref:Ti-type conjugative transfer relaxase TraA n=1 Tax=Mariprofundus aestuarium TaxID=1921086 RepID=A0A2K8L7C3_MARES|nr:MobF family relaxase [Mariprofundus aestuarium]ATX80166.1 Ti-type conjugative transfer relaxase TraA [Mariprofundus aestuarium]